MDAMNSVYAQSQSIGPLEDGTAWIFLIAALILIGAALFFIFMRFEVTSGHAIILGVAFAIGALPYVANFEWTKDGFKFTTKGESLELAKQIEELTRNDTRSREQLNILATTLENATRRVSALESATARAGGPAPPEPESGRSLLESFRRQNDAIIQQNASRIDEITAFQRRLQGPIR